jgi:hypothetical protein
VCNRNPGSCCPIGGEAVVTYSDRVDDRHVEAPSWVLDLRRRVEELLDGYRGALWNCLDGLTEDEARSQLVSSNTTLLGLVKHVTYVEAVWFDQAIHGSDVSGSGVAGSPAESFVLLESDAIASVRDAHRQRCETSRGTMAAFDLDAVVGGRGERPVWALHLQVLRELAQHAGHADILREQLLANRITWS